MESSSHQLLYSVTMPSDILRELQHSRDHGNAVGITALSFSPSMIITAVDDIISIDGERVVLIKETDLLGIKIPESDIPLSEIVRVYPLRTKYNDPFHIRLRERREKDGMA